MEKLFLMKFKNEIQPLSFVAERIEFHADHIAFVKSDGTLVAMVLGELVESWSEMPPARG